MTTKRSDRDRVHGASVEGETFLGKGADASVWRTSDGQFVRKCYLDTDRELAGIRAEQEFAALQTARQALEVHVAVHCPEPYRVDHARGELLLEYYDGKHLNRALEHERFADRREIRRLAENTGRAMTLLTRELSLNQLDFSLRNTLVNPERGEICLIDFSTRISPRVDHSGARPLEVAVASMLSSTITYQLHQETIFNVTASRRLRKLARDLYCAIAEDHPLDARRTRDMAWRFYWRQSVNRGWKRFIWFNTLGALAFKFLLDRATRSTTGTTPAVLDERTVR